MKSYKKKGAMLIMTLGFLMVAFSFLGFSVDTARLLYYKVYNQNVANAVALSIVHETAVPYTDNNGNNKAFLVTSKTAKFDLGNKMEFYADNYDYIHRNITMKNDDDKSTYTPIRTRINPGQPSRYFTGKNSKNGEVLVEIYSKVDLLFTKSLNALFGSSDANSKGIKNISVAGPSLITSGSVHIKDEFLEITRPIEIR